MAAFTGTTIDDKPRADTVVGTDHAWSTHAFKGEIIGIEPLIGNAGGNSFDGPGAFESMTRPHADGVMLLHGDFSSLVDAGTGTAFAGDGLGSSHSVAGGSGARLADISDGTSNTIMFRNAIDRDATDNVIESVGTKYTLLETMADDSDNLLHAKNDDHLPRGNMLDVCDLLIGFDAAVANVVDDARTSTPDGSALIQADRDGHASGGVPLDMDIFSGVAADLQVLPTDPGLPLD